MKLVITRHTTTDWNLMGRIQSRTDNSLNEQGRMEAEELAKSLSYLGIKRVISSDLKRAKETAEIIISVLRMPLFRPFNLRRPFDSRIPLISDERLRECSFGEIEGLIQREAINEYGEAVAMDLGRSPNYNYDFRPYGGECREQVFKRYMEVVKFIVREHSDKLTLLVGHGRGTRTLLEGLGYDDQTVNFRRGDYRIINF